MAAVFGSVYDESGRAVYSTGSFPEGSDPAQITGTHTIYDAQGRVESSQQLLGIDIDIIGSVSKLSSVLMSAGSVISSSRSFYDDANRVYQTENNYGLRTQTLYGQFGEVIESRSETVASDDTRSWLVSRSLYDTLGRVSVSTDRFLVPTDTPLGEDPADSVTGARVPVFTQVTKTVYDDRGRTIATERYAGAQVSLTQSPSLDYSPLPTLVNPGTLETVSETLYDAAGRVYRTVSGRVPISSLSGVALAQDQALVGYPVYAGGLDRYADAGLSSGIISDTLFDDRGRQYASLGHPLPAEDIGLSGPDYDGNLARVRSETLYNSYGQTELSRSGLVHVETADGTFVGVFDEQSIDSKPHYDAFGNVYRSDVITGGTISYDASEGRTTRSSGTVESYTLTRFDDENRPVAEMQTTAGDVTAVWSVSEKSFVIDGTSTYIPTKLYIYDADDRLAAVELPAPDPEVSSLRPKYEYSYDERGNQTGITDPLGHETRFTFTERGQQASRTLPLGFGDDGIFGTADDASATDFSESMTYDDLGRQRLHISFEGVVKENIYDGFGRMSAINYYASESNYAAGLIDQRDEYVFDTYGRRSGWTRYEATTPVALATGVTNAADDPNFAATRTEATIFDIRGRVLHDISREGTLSYDYDAQGRMTYTAIDAGIPAVVGPSGTAADPSTAERVTTYAYDILGRLANVTEDATPSDGTDDPQTDTGYSYDLLGRKRAQLTIAPGDTVPNSVETSYLYDSLGRLDVMTDTDAAGNTLASYDYEVRPDGKRTTSTETFWFDENSDGQLTANELKANSYSWTYDDAGRLTDEVLDHWDDAFDQTESFTYDLTGNRESLTSDKGNDGTTDEAITYTYDANDRLLDEVLDSIVDTDDTTTTYAYDQTQQTSKMVTSTTDQLPVSSQSFTYNLQGRMASVVNEGYDASGTLTSRERTGYAYDSKSYRVKLTNETDAALDGNFTLDSITEFLASHRNKTGYTQTLRESKFDADGNPIKQIDYTFGDDEIAQRVREFDAAGVVTSDQTFVFGHDGHGSVRVLYDLSGAAAKIIQAFTFSAYGQMMALHNAMAQSTAVSDRLSSTGYSGETFDSASQQQYLRARFYNSANGRFNRLDPFIGNNTDPQSLHKYAYVHGDAVQMTDPSGESAIHAVFTALDFIGIYYEGVTAGYEAFLAGDDPIDGLKYGWIYSAFASAAIGLVVAVAAPWVPTAFRLLRLSKGFWRRLFQTFDLVPKRFTHRAIEVIQSFCFAENTQVSVDGGFVPIQSLNVGDFVQSYDFSKGVWTRNRVDAAHRSEFTGDMITIEFDGSSVVATEQHPFWVLEGKELKDRTVPRGFSKQQDRSENLAGRWVLSDELREGDILAGCGNTAIRIERVSRNAVVRFPVYNLTIDSDPNFCVGSRSALVHNTGGCGRQFIPTPPNINFADLAEDVLYRILRGDKKGRAFGSPSSPAPPTLEQFNPRILEVRADALDASIAGRKHGQFPDQQAAIQQLSNDDLLRFRPDDPMSVSGAPDALLISGGHHRTSEITRRVQNGILPPDTKVNLLFHD